MANALPCGCIPGYYWCSRHDIPSGSFASRVDSALASHDIVTIDTGSAGCTCFLSAPCSYCLATED